MSTTLEYRGKLAIITLNEPKKLNALSSAQYVILASQMREIAARDDVYITLLIGQGRFFSAGANVKVTPQPQPTSDITNTRLQTLQNLSHIPEVTSAFYTHPKLLITALNGPVIGLSAALVAHSDFIYAVPNTYLLAPFTSLGIAAEGASTTTFIQRLGWARAHEALLMSKRITCAELQSCGFINEVFDTTSKEHFQARVIEEIDARLLGDHLDPQSILTNKALLRRPLLQLLQAQTQAETLAVADCLSSPAAMHRREQKKASAGNLQRHKL